ncbi:hypothetical protein GGS23DRAFT_595400 [Durotheca rogersii]|uniref:uncharacterized protein n=1 Tax=Durotheca rogersii TaxID=419775 RepID=UPI0022209431|nr:uncharacterized protein GGS23DRAFT_595400 [Durotheca rogersii]KAI5864688.1 hypothetical protein GGS23DRAFT_595400 [Durotheca rogersii]
MNASSARQQQPWHPRDARRSRNDLEADIKSLNDDIGGKGKNHFHQQRLGIMEFRLRFPEYKEASRDNVPEGDRDHAEQARNPELQILAYRQVEDMAEKQATKLRESRTGLSAILFSLFTSSL